VTEETLYICKGKKSILRIYVGISFFKLSQRQLWHQWVIFYRRVNTQVAKEYRPRASIEEIGGQRSDLNWKKDTSRQKAEADKGPKSRISISWPNHLEKCSRLHKLGNHLPFLTKQHFWEEFFQWWELMPLIQNRLL